VLFFYYAINKEIDMDEEMVRLHTELSRLRGLLTKAAETRETELRAAHDWGYTEAKTGEIALDRLDSFYGFLVSLRVKQLK